MADKKPNKRQYDDPTREWNGGWQDLVESCLDSYDEIEGSEYRAKKIAEIKEAHEVYDQVEKTTNDPWPGASNIDLPLTVISIDNLEPRLVAGLVGREPYIQFTEESDDPQDDDTEILETWYNSELKDVVKLETEAGSLIHMLLIEGTVYPMGEYDLEKRIVMDFADPLPGGQAPPQEKLDEWKAAGAQVQGDMLVGPDGSPLTEEREETIREGGKIDYIPFTDVFIPDDADDWEKTDVIRKVYPTYAELMRYAQGERVGYISDNIGPWLCKEAGSGKLTEAQQSPVQSTEGIEVTGRETIECIECIVRYIYKEEKQDKEDVTDFTEERYVAQIALDRQVLIRLVKLRELNWRNEHYIKRIRLYPEKGRAYGTGIYGKMKAIQKGASKVFNSCMNVAEIALVPWFFHTDKAGMKADQAIHPGAGVKVDDIKEILFPNFNINPREYIDFLYLWTQFWERLVSIGDLQVGRPNEENKTATETLAVIQEGNIKHNYQAHTFREEFLSLLRTIYDLYYQYMPLTKTFLYNNQQVPISRRTMRRKFKFTLTGSTDKSNKLIERKENEDLAMITGRNPQFASITNPVVLLEDILKSYGRTDTSKYIDPFIAQLTATLEQMPQLKPVIENAVKQATQMAQQMEQAANGYPGEVPA